MGPIMSEHPNGNEDLESLLDSVTVPPDLPIAEAISRLDQAGTGALVLCEPGRHLQGVLTDGDIRRGILRKVPLDACVREIAVLDPIVAHAPLSAADGLGMMLEHDINHLPVVDGDGNLLDLLLRKNLVGDADCNLSAVIMAGGYGRRLHPLTERIPKPMLPFGDRPLLERTIEQLRRAGIREVHMTTHYLPERIVSHFGDGGAFGVKIEYANEDQPLGTAGGLKLLPKPDGPFLVINGDVLTAVSYQDMLRHHQRQGALITVGVRVHQIQVPFGVVECEDALVRELREKPTLTLLVNAGIYLLEPAAHDYIPDGQRFDMTDLIRALLAEGRMVASFPVIEYWQDIGQHESYRQAQQDLLDGRI
jgi:dTDP-glucose pyrophosphorylase/CBS domain-containing protein